MKIPNPRKLPSGMYTLQLRLDGRSVSITKSTARECVKAAELIKAEHRNGKVVESPEAITLRAACDRYIAQKDRVLSPSTIRGYKEITRNRFQSVMDQPIGRIRSWQSVINDEAALVSPKTVRNAWLFIKPVLRCAGATVPAVTLPQVAPNDLPWLDYDQILILINAVRDLPVELGCLLALNGLRRSEIYALDKSSIDCKKMEIRVRGARVEGPDGYVKKKTNKNTSSTRTVPILIPRIAELVAEASDPLMVYSEKHLCGHINDVCRRVGLPLVGTHGCRRSFASWCAHERIPEDVCMAWGGWKDMITMRKIYTKVSQADKDSYADLMRSKVR